MDQNQYQEVQIDVVLLLKLIIKKWWQITIFAAVVTLLAGYYAYFVKDDVYTADSSMIIQVTTENDSVYTELQTGRILADTYEEFAQSNLVLNQVKEELELDYSNNDLSRMINITSVNDTLIVKLTVEGESPSEVRSIANTLVKVVQTESKNFEGLENVEILDVAIEPTTPSGPNRLMYIVIGAVLGSFIGLGFIFLVEFFDQSIKSGKDLENKLNIRLLGIVPEYDMDEGVES